MKSGATLALLVTAIASVLAARSHFHGQSQDTHSPCRAITFENEPYTECIATPGQNHIATRLAGSDGRPYRSFARLAGDIPVETIAFAMNGGMFDISEPIGYYSELGRKQHPINDRAGNGNFYMKPNGVFFGDADGNWRVLKTEAYADTVRNAPAFGTQSGPMLVVDGAIPSEISPNGTSLNVRNAVGVDPLGRAHFVISDQRISFGTLARLMRDHVRAQNALYLDGLVSSLWNPAAGRMDGGPPLGPLIVVTKDPKSRGSVAPPLR